MKAKWGSKCLSGAIVIMAVTIGGRVAGQGVFPPAYHHEVYTPLEWQPKLINSSRDLNQNFVDDEIDAMPRTNRVNIILDLNDCVDVSRFSAYGGITYTGRYLTVVCLTNVIVTNAIALGQDSEVAMVELSRIGQVMLDKSVPNIRVRSSVNYTPNTVQDAYPTINGTGVNIAILDTGVDDGVHESLPASKFIGGYNAITDTELNPDDDNGHGTHVAGIALGTGGASGTYRGVAPGAGLVDIKVADAGGFVATPDLLRAIDKCIEHRTDWNIGVASMSLGFCGIVDHGNDSISQAVNRLVMAGIVAVVAMGNTPNCGLPNNTQEVIAPAAADYAISVAASDDHNAINRTLSTLATYSLTGPRLDDGDTDPYDELKPDVTAPGTAIHSALFNTVNGYIDDSGTSMATPHVAGLAALIIQAAAEAGQTISPFSVRKLIRDTAEPRGTHPLAVPLPDAPNWDKWWGYGLVDGYAAINQLETSLKTDLRFDQNTSSPDPGNWLSADLFPTDPFVQEGVANVVQANIRNNGPNPVSNFQVHIGIYGFSNGDLDYDIGTVTVPGPLAPGAVVSISLPWTPQISGTPPGTVHACLKGHIIWPYDTDFSNNNAQHNVDIQQTHSPATFAFRVVNPTGTNISITVSNDRPANSQWTLVVAGVTNGPVTFPMGARECPRTLQATLTPPPNLVGTQAVNLRVFGSISNSTQVIPLGGVRVVAVVPSSNAPPIAASDSYNYLPGQTLNVAAPGVLANDSDPNGDPISAVLVTPAQHGQVLLLANGSFSYTPQPGYSGSDAFIYQATDGKGARSLSAFVGLNPLPPALTVRQTITGVINGQPFSGGGYIYYSNSPAIPTGMSLVIDFTNSPLVVNPILWDCVCLGHDSTNLLNSINVFNAVGPVFHLQRNNTVFDANFNPLGSFAVSMDFQMTSPNQAVANLNVQGNYTGPTDIVQSNGTIRANGYTMALRQTGPTNIVGRFIQSVYENSGTVLLNVVTNNYTYPAGGGPGLPFDELSHVQVNSVGWNDASSSLSVSATGYCDPAPATTGSLFTLAESVSGQLNGMGFGANGSMIYNRSFAPSPMTNSMSYAYFLPIWWPPNWWPPGGWNDITYDCYGGGLLLTNDVVKGLRDVLGPVFHLERNSIVLGASNAVLSSATMHMDHQALSPNWGVTDTAMEGLWNMPYSIVPSAVSETGFTMHLHQSGPNTIVGSYQKNLYLTNGMVLTNVVNDTWTYPAGGGPGLPFDEVAHIQVIERTWDGTNAYFEGTGYYEAAAPMLVINENSNETFTLIYTGTLYSSPTVTGPYNPVPGASSPWTVNPRAANAAPTQFYRAGP